MERVRTGSFLLGIGLAILWIVGLTTPGATGWLTWMSGLAALGAFMLSGSLTGSTSRRLNSSVPIGLSLILFFYWIIGLSTGAVAWQTWSTFVFGCIFLGLGLAASSTVRALPRFRKEISQDQFRKSA
jgi:hypothetical protein